MNTSTTITKIAPAFLKAQKTIESVIKDSTNPYFKSKYADLTAVIDACKDKLNDNGIMILQPVNEMTVETILIHESGEWFSSATPVVCKSQNDPQALGSAITYAKRYGLQSMVLLPAEDDDAEGATTHTPKQENTPATSQYSGSQTILASDAQVKAIHTLLGLKGRTTKSIEMKFGTTHASELDRAQASQLIDALTKLPDIEKVDPDSIPV